MHGAWRIESHMPVSFLCVHLNPQPLQVIQLNLQAQTIIVFIGGYGERLRVTLDVSASHDTNLIKVK